jgi:hypothetical protein
MTGVVEQTVTEPFAEHEALPDGSALMDPEFRRELIRRAAYRLADQRGFEPGRELDDWLAAEVAIDRQRAGCTPEA